MLVCPVCKLRSIVNSRRDLFSHLNRHKKDGEVTVPIICVQNVDAGQECQAQTNTIKDYVRHFLHFHPADIQLRQLDNETNSGLRNRESEEEEEEEETESTNNMDIDDGGIDNMEIYGDVDDEPSDDNEPSDNDESSDDETSDSDQEDDDFFSSLKESAFEMILALRSKNGIPYSTTVDILKYVEEFVVAITNKISAFINRMLIDVEDIRELPDKLAQANLKFDTLRKVFTCMNTEWKIQKMYKMHPRFVAPEKIKLGRNPGSATFNFAEYCSIEKTIKALVLDQEYSDLLFYTREEPSENGVYAKFTDGSRYKNNELFSENSMTGGKEGPRLMLQVFADGVGLSGTLRGGKHSATMFYFTILNLPQRFNAALANIHLIAICKSKDLDGDDGYNVILRHIVDEIKKLETDGFDVFIPNKGRVRVFGTIAHFTADNLGINEAFGLVQSFNCDFCCAVCYATKAQMAHDFQEESFELRTPEKYDEDLRELADSGLERVRGVVRFCVYNELIHFHSMDNWGSDSMHNVCEGVIPYGSGCFLYSIMQEEPTITVEFINARMQEVFSQSKVDKSNKPPPLKSINAPGYGISPTLSATQYMALFLKLPAMLSRYVARNSKPWKLLIMLREIVNIVMAPKLNEAILSYFEIRYAEFLQLFKQFYPDVSIRPKMHFLVHFPTVVRKNGPLKNLWVMNYERMNGSIKIPTHTMNNFRNPKKTLAFKRQCAALHSLLEKKMLRDSIDIGQLYESSVHDFPQEELLTFFQPNNRNITVSKKITINGVEYSQNVFMLMKPNSPEFTFSFGRIECFICELQPPLFLLNMYSILEFDHHSFSYIVTPNINQRVIARHEDFFDVFPLDGIADRDGNFLVGLKHLVW